MSASAFPAFSLAANKDLTFEQLLLCSQTVTDFTNPMKSAWTRTKESLLVAPERVGGGDVQESNYGKR